MCFFVLFFFLFLFKPRAFEEDFDTIVGILFIRLLDRVDDIKFCCNAAFASLAEKGFLFLTVSLAAIVAVAGL